MSKNDDLTGVGRRVFLATCWPPVEQRLRGQDAKVLHLFEIGFLHIGCRPLVEGDFLLLRHCCREGLGVEEIWDIFLVGRRDFAATDCCEDLSS